MLRCSCQHCRLYDRTAQACSAGRLEEIETVGTDVDEPYQSVEFGTLDMLENFQASRAFPIC